MNGNKRGPPPTIMIVDDEERNRRLAEAMLLPLGYKTVLAGDGAEALEKVDTTPPDVILLDIMMPKMDGYETVSHLKADDVTRIIPVVMVTALDHTKDRVKALRAGADDFLSKPIDKTELQARVKSLVKVKAYHDHMRAHRQTLEEQNRVLRENQRLREDIDLIMRHDLKAPLNGIINLPRMIHSGGTLSEKQNGYLKKIVQQGYKMLGMINLSLDLYKMEHDMYRLAPVPVDILPIIDEILDENIGLIQSKGVPVVCILDGGPIGNGTEFILSGERLLFYSMLANTLKNALEASFQGETISIAFKRGRINTISIHNQRAVPADIRDRFFEKYVTAGKRGGTGLGTYSAGLIAKSQGGAVELKTSEMDGTTVMFSFPDPEVVRESKGRGTR